MPDVLQYKDQLEEVNLLTGRIHALSDALEAKGFYPAGGAEISDAVQAAIKMKTPGRLLVPISNWAAFGGSKEVIIWLPIDMIAQTITALVALRKQVIEDIYQIIGLSDIMRGQTDPQETLGAQELKTDYGSTRIRDKQSELVRVARDLAEIVAEIITEKFSPVTMIEMSQTQLPTLQMVQRQIQQVVEQMQQHHQQALMMIQQPQIQQMAQQNPEQAQQLQQQFQQMQQAASGTIIKLKEKPTIEQVLEFLKDNRTKSFVLDIETDSTIQADENAEKQRRSEFVGVLGGLLPQLAQMIAAQPQCATFCGELLKFATAPFRAGRSLDGAIDDLVAQMEQQGSQNQTDNNPAQINAKTALQIEQMKDKRQRDKDQMDQAMQAAELKQKDDHKKMELFNAQRIEQMRLSTKQGDQQAKVQVQNQKAMESREAHQMQMLEGQQDMQINREKAEADIQKSIASRAQMAEKMQQQRAQAQFKMTQPQRPVMPGG